MNNMVGAQAEEAPIDKRESSDFRDAPAAGDEQWVQDLGPEEMSLFSSLFGDCILRGIT